MVGHVPHETTHLDIHQVVYADTSQLRELLATFLEESTDAVALLALFTPRLYHSRTQGRSSTTLLTSLDLRDLL